MNPAQRDVCAFHIALGIPAPDHPAPLSPERADLRIRLLREEVEEFAKAAGECRGWRRLLWWRRPRSDLVASVHELVDVLVVAYGALVELGVDADPFWAEVMAANMRKIGGPVRADGKILKGPMWKPADLQRVFSEHYGKAE
jgi:predicted HAD superfamily Cof-like phosphohydrolase